MCGLAGFIRLNQDTETPTLTKRIFSNLFLTSQLRGYDSSGAAGMWIQKPRTNAFKRKRKPLKGWLVYKDLDGPATTETMLRAMVDMKAARKTQTHDSAYIAACLGHSRAATLGSVIEANAHPFSFFNNRFIGTHNGTVRNAKYVFNTLDREGTPLPGTLKSDKDYGAYGKDAIEYTDSETLLYCIYRYGLKAVYELMEGAWALVWYNQATGKVYFIRNEQRDLFLYWDTERDALFWSSEQEMLRFAFDREGSRLKYSNLWKPKQCQFFRPHTLYEVDVHKSRLLVPKDGQFPWTNVIDFTQHKKKAWSYVASNNYSGGRYNAKKHETNTKTPTNLPVVHRMAGGRAKENDNNKTRHRSVVAVFYSTDPTQPEESVDESRECHCVWCDAKIIGQSTDMRIPAIDDMERDEWLCFNCNNDWYIIDQVVEMYPHLSDEPEWVDQALYLENERVKQKGLV